MLDLIIIITFLAITYLTGRYIEKNHYKKIKQREIALIRKPIISFGAKRWTTERKIKDIKMVTGEAVIAGDYFKAFTAGIKQKFGGNLSTYESVIDRARREALIRMREKATKADIIVNVRLESILLNQNYIQYNIPPQCAIIAYGTAVTYENE